MAAAQGIRAGRAFVELFADDSKLVRGLKAAQRRLRNFGASVRAMGAKMLAVGSLVAGPLAFSVKAASDMEETMNKFNVVFGASAKVVKEWGDSFGAEVGRSKQQIADFLAEIDAEVYVLDCLPNLNGQKVRDWGQESTKEKLKIIKRN